MALSTLLQVLLRALVSIVVQLKWRPALDDAIAMYFPADPASLHSFPPCLLYQQQGILFIVPVKKYRLLFIRFITGIFGRGIGTLTVRVYRCGPLNMNRSQTSAFILRAKKAEINIPVLKFYMLDIYLGHGVIVRFFLWIGPVDYDITPPNPGPA